MTRLDAIKARGRCGVFCNVVRYVCEACRRHYSWCLGHERPTMANRCVCHTAGRAALEEKK